MSLNDPTIFTVVIPAGASTPVKRPPSSRELARRREAAEAEARAAVEAKALARQVQTGLRPPPGKLFAVDGPGMLIIGPAGAIGSTARMIATLEPLTAKGRHALSVLAAAGRWDDEVALRDALTGMAGKLAAVGLRIDRRKAGLRATKSKPSTTVPAIGAAS